MSVTDDTSQPPMGALKVDARSNVPYMVVNFDVSQAPMDASKAAAP